jgi:hypothetical protein
MYMMELRDSRARSRAPGLVCLLCGEIVDPVIAGNRLRPLQDIIQMAGTKLRRRRARRSIPR